MTAEAQKRIFIIGPMTEGKNDPTGIEWAQHIENIANALEDAISILRNKHGDKIGAYEIIQPPRNIGNIRRNVFPHIMHCDLAVADLSSKSPNVLYELAILHANGTPVILIDYKENINNQDIVFYLNQDSLIGVDDFSEVNIYKSLTAEDNNKKLKGKKLSQLELVLLGSERLTYWNPITEHFGGVALVNVAAAAGVATGQYYNFLKWVLQDGGIFSDPTAEVDGIILLRPDRIKQVDEIKSELIRRFGKDSAGHQGKATGDLPSFRRDVEGHPRGCYFFYKVGRYIVDYPTPISSLSVSRQYLEMIEYARTHSMADGEDILRRFEKKIIDIYFRTLESLARGPHNNWHRVLVRSLPDAIQLLEAGKSRQ